jgi:WD40 repeat protein
MGQAIEGMVDDSHFGHSLELAMDSSEVMILAVGEADQVRTYRYDQDADSWTQFGSALQGDETSESIGAAHVHMSADGSILAVGVWNERNGVGIGNLRSFSYNATLDDWIETGNLEGGQSFLFGAFALSGNGKVLVTATEELDAVTEQANHQKRDTGQVRVWDFSAMDENTTGATRGEWIQRGSTLQGSIQHDQFGHQVAVSTDGGYVATSAPYAINAQGLETGKLSVFEEFIL